MLGRPKVPAALRSRFDKDERLLALADGDAAVVAATNLGLWLPVEDAWRRVGWHEVVKATWTEAGLEVIEGVADAEGVVADQSPVRYRLREPRNLPVVVRQRVERSIGRWEQVRVPGGTGRIVGRRAPGVNGVRWTARVDSGTPDTPEARSVLVDYLNRVKALPTGETADF
ncbi:MAG TPA: hypothetical protein VHO01_05665 [Jatrophihabitans sp.]|nr:hypothetical protein [Jatrophihabitans sp.]